MPTTAQPLDLSLGAALKWLRTQYWGLESSLGYLRTIHHKSVLLDLYQQCFPNEFARSKGDLAPQISYGTQEAEFFDLLDEQWFPLFNSIDEGEICDVVAVRTLGFNIFEVEIGDLEVTDILGAGLYEHLEWETVLDQLKVTGDVLKPVESEEIRWEVLEQTFRGSAEPLCYFPLVIQVLGRFTDNLFFDNSWEDQMEGFEWTMKDLTWLRDEFSKTKAIQEQMNQLNLWIEEDPNRVGAIVALWNQCASHQQLEIPLMPKVQIVPSSQLESALKEQYAAHRHHELAHQ